MRSGLLRHNTPNDLLSPIENSARPPVPKLRPSQRCTLARARGGYTAVAQAIVAQLGVVP
jgi:hypothetical protein